MTTQKEPYIEFHDVTVAYAKKPVLWNIDMHLPKGALIGIVGPNGAGKSTLLKATMGLLPLASGFIHLDGKPFTQQRQKVGYVPQRESVDWDFPVTVEEVVMMGTYGQLGLLRRSGKREKALVQQALEQVDMWGYRKRQIAQLSGGQQQRVFLARALAQEAEVYVMDEPFAGVDAATESAILLILQSLTQQGKTVMVVHHDLQSAASYFDWMVLLNMRLVASGPIDEVFTTEKLQETYGGKLTVLAEVSELLHKRQVKSRENY